jgi:hypothetical protein
MRDNIPPGTRQVGTLRDRQVVRSYMPVLLLAKHVS